MQPIFLPHFRLYGLASLHVSVLSYIHRKILKMLPKLTELCSKWGAVIGPSLCGCCNRGRNPQTSSGAASRHRGCRGGSRRVPASRCGRGKPRCNEIILVYSSSNLCLPSTFACMCMNVANQDVRGHWSWHREKKKKKTEKFTNYFVYLKQTGDRRHHHHHGCAWPISSHDSSCQPRGSRWLRRRIVRRRGSGSGSQGYVRRIHHGHAGRKAHPRQDLFCVGPRRCAFQMCPWNTGL